MKTYVKDILLYAKGYYYENNRINDLKTIISKHEDISIKYITDFSIAKILLQISFYYLGWGEEIQKIMIDSLKIIDEIRPEFIQSYIDYYFNILRNLPVKNPDNNQTLIKLSRPNPDILSVRI